MEADNKKTLENYRVTLEQYVKLEEQASKFANKISNILYKLDFLC